MSQKITLAQLQQWLLLFADAIDANKQLLTELDAAIGDADHGINMQLGMTKVRERVHSLADDSHDISAFLRTIAMTLISSVGGAAGPLYGAFFLRAARDSVQAGAITLTELAQMFRSGLEGVQQRGKAQPDDKTMVDALEPAVRALEEAASRQEEVETALASACRAAEEGMRHTIDMEAKKGRASYLGPRSIGHQDPGATSTYLLIKSAVEAFSNNHADGSP